MSQKNVVEICKDDGQRIDIPVLYWKGQRIITLQDVAAIHKVALRTVQRDFQRNVGTRLLETTHYFRFEGAKDREALIVMNNSDIESLLREHFGEAKRWLRIGLTERGYLRLCKIMTDEVSWSVQEQLINVYYHMQELRNNPFQMLRAAADELEAKFTQLGYAIEKNAGKTQALIEVQDTLNNGYERELSELKKLTDVAATKLPAPENDRTKVVLEKSYYDYMISRCASMEREIEDLRHEFDFFKKYNHPSVTIDEEVTEVVKEKPSAATKSNKQLSNRSRKAYWERYRACRTCKSLAENLGLYSIGDNPHYKFIMAISNELGYTPGDGNITLYAYENTDGKELYSNVTFTYQGVNGILDYWRNIMSSYRMSIRNGKNCRSYKIGNRMYNIFYKPSMIKASEEEQAG